MAAFRASGGSEPAINLPPATLGLILANLAVHLVRQLLPAEIEIDWVQALAFVPLRYSRDLQAVGGSEAASLLAPLAFQFLHGGWLHLGVNCLTLAAFGAPLERLLGVRRYLVFYLLCGLASALGQFLVDPLSDEAMVGASGGISGLFGGMLVLLALRRGGLRWLVPVVGLMVAINVVFGLIGLPGNDEAIAWVAHIAGLAAGLLLIPLFAFRRSGDRR